ncbi:hypothetical protein L2E71_21230 [Planktothrix agardhii 1032]|uniref:hypothetical protein n=1 Tax=Planktothrix agardhii TaxID=1160 RepID=UPI001F4785AB|nr:hypothetical protein [Planktothrix agardhii]MCF3600588.1 hypothetical protein [Planktothrix agardhii 1032]
MAYRIKINGVVAVVENGVWTSSTPHYAEILNNMLAIEKMGAIDPDSPFFWLNSPATPDPDWLIATEMAKSFDGVVMDDPCGSCQLRCFCAWIVRDCYQGTN